MQKIKFGTDGWRGEIARDFTFANVEMVTRAVAAYLREKGLADRGAVVAYDNRFLADRFAAAAGEVLRRWGIPVYLPESAVPTPVAAFAIRYLNAGGAVVLTASHNPPEYCGIKFIPEYAGPALPDVTERIEALLAGLPPAPKAERAPLQVIEPMEEYFTHLATLIDGEAIRRAGLKVVVDPMYGAGIGYLDGLLRRLGVEVLTIHGYRDPLFGGGLPDPAEARLEELRDAVLSGGAHLGLALDGDADRLGIIDADGTYISPNQLLAIVCYHLLAQRSWRGPVARTVATTHLVDRIAAGYGVEVYETPVGFKYIGRCLRDYGCICGGEESGGLSIRGHVPEKDGILAGLLAAEVVALHEKPLLGVLAEVFSRFGRVASSRVDYRTTLEEKERVLKLLAGFCPVELAGQAVKRRTAADGVKLELVSGAWLLVRASGTEPVFRVYAEAAAREEVAALQEAMRQELGL
uniref:Phosphoglucomutase n=1 Tax=Ammonifex degensii TaxID=42838 RepID=A0A7C2EJM9_9THEO